MQNERILSCNHLTIELSREGKPVKVVDDLSFELSRGETLVFVGESGAGKSVSLLSLLRLLPTPPFKVSRGEVYFENEEILSLPYKKFQKLLGKKIAVIFQDPKAAFNPVFTVGEQLKESALYHFGSSEEEAMERSYLALEEVFLLEPKKAFASYPHELSGGMLQRAMIAMALIASPTLLIADEPTTALDVTLQAQILRLLKELKEKRHLSILLITHDLKVVREMADNVCVLYKGELLEKASHLHFFAAPSHPYTQELFSYQNYKPSLFTPCQKNASEKGCSYHLRCPFAMKQCQNIKPPLFNLPSNKQWARCYLYDRDLENKLDFDEQDIRS